MPSRRLFFRKAAGMAGFLSIAGLSTYGAAKDISGALNELHISSPEESIQNDELWKRIQQAYTISPNIINLNNGGVSPQPKVVQDAVDRYYHLSNEAPSYYMWQILDKGRESVRMKLADLAGCSKEEIAINRNTTEALDNAIFGISLRKGDEVILTKQDYPNMINAWKQREMRDGIKLIWVNLDLPTENEDSIIDAYTAATTSRTKVYHITHMINWNGQILPVARLCAEAGKRNITTIVDGAHTFAHIDYNINELGCDYFGTSLHKWLCAPFGTGMLYVRKEKIAETWPLLSSPDPKSDDIRKFESLGTRSFAPEQAIGHAVNFHNAIGSKLKEDRLRYLKNYWCDQVKEHPRISLGTPAGSNYSCALAIVDLQGMEPIQLYHRLFKEYAIHTSPIVWENIKGVRITPHVYTLKKDLDRLATALLTMADEK